MNNPLFSLTSAILVGLGATLMFDLWGLFLEHTLNVPASNMCLVGRWILYMPEGIFRHSNIASAPQKSRECLTGWVAHYTIGIAFAVSFVALATTSWLQHPRLMPALIFGVLTVSMPFFIMQPLFGLGFAASKTPNPAQARFRTVANHVVFGIGLYLCGWLVNELASIVA